MKKKEIIIVAHHLTIGGIQKSLISALNIIDYNKYNVTLYIRKNRLDLLPYVNSNVRVLINDDKNKYYSLPKSIFYQIIIAILSGNQRHKEKYVTKLADYIRKKQFCYEKKHFFTNSHYDIAISYLQGYEALFVDKIIDAKKKIVFYQGSTDETHEAHEKCLHNYNAIVVEHPDVMKMLISCYPKISESQFVVIENYVDKDFIFEQANAITIDKSEFTLVTVGRIAYVKGFDLAVEAARILKESGLDFQWFFVGDGPDREKVELLINSYNLQNTIILTGMQKNPYPYVLAADAFVQPSREEAMSIAVLEAQILCKPVVTTKTVGGMNIVKDGITGIQTDIDSNSLADGILKLANNHDLHKIIISELKKVDYSEEKKRYSHDWAKLLEEK